MKARRIIFAAIALLVISGLALGLVRNTSAVHDLGLFELDRNAVADGLAPGDDWNTLYAGGGSAKAFTSILPDIGADGGTQFHAGGSKDNNDITEWLWNDGEPLDKDDITNAYAAAYVNAVDSGENDIGDLILYFGLDRFAVNGSAQVGFWFLQDPNFGLSNTPSQGGFKFNGVHLDNDVLIQSNFSNGGVISSITVYKWQSGALVKILDAADCLAGSPFDDPACATVNQSAQTAPWPYTPKTGPAGTFPTSAFYEGGVNISRLIPNVGCFTGFMAETRSSTPFDARLKDFAIGNFSLCNMNVTKAGDTLSKVGDPVNYTITVENTGALPLYKDDISDSVLGAIAIDGVDQANPYVVSNTCGASLAPDASCTITLQRTVQAGDPDPLPNTATAVYRGKADLTGTGITKTDDHTVNLFQPSIVFDKSADTALSKVGDDVVYTLTLQNTSSSDSPDLVCTITDEMLEVDKQVTLASGAQDETVVTYTVLESDPDPLDNTASVSCSPVGFPNILTASDSWSVNLFQPAILVDKTGDLLSKVGDPVNYTITLSNNSSADTPPMICLAEDTLIGTVFSGVLPLGDTVIQESRDVEAGDPDPLINTVSMDCVFTDFPNVLSAEDSHETNLFQPSITFDKSADTELSKVGDIVNYTLTLNNTSSPDSPDLECTITDELLGVDKDVTLASGEGDVTLEAYTVLAGDPDPLSNTASVSCSPIGFPNILTANDSWEVNLFQPSIAVDKTGDALGKIGDPVDYVITLSNTSSADTPVISCVAEDSLLGDVYDGVLPLGDTAIPYSRTVLESDPDPLVNSVDVTCTIAGFPNILNASDSFTTNLFQPGVEVLKSGPDTGARGETVTYSFTINNLSSSDSPNLTLESVVDTVIGDLTPAASSGGCGSIASGSSCTFDVDYTIQLSDPSPLTNVVTVLYHPSGFPNDITDDDSHTLTMPIMGCTPGFWQGGAGAELWNEANDPDWGYAGSNPFSHTDLFNDFFSDDPVSSLDGLTMYDLVSTGGGADPAVKAARDMVAAYLNEAALGGDFPADSLADLEDMWYQAVQDGDAGFEDFHTLVGGWNDPLEPGYCPLP